RTSRSGNLGDPLWVLECRGTRGRKVGRNPTPEGALVKVGPGGVRGAESAQLEVAPQDGEPSSGRSLGLLEPGAVLQTPRTGAPGEGPEERGRALPAAGESRRRLGTGEDRWARGWAPRLKRAPGLGLGPQRKEDPGLPHPRRLVSGPAVGAARALSCRWDQTLKRARSRGGGTQRNKAGPRGPSEREVRDLRKEPPNL
ncbi:hypothetical protein NDU88_005180, partial [Pleurodeles waltl]